MKIKRHENWYKLKPISVWKIKLQPSLPPFLSLCPCNLTLFTTPNPNIYPIIMSKNQKYYRTSRAVSNHIRVACFSTKVKKVTAINAEFSTYCCYGRRVAFDVRKVDFPPINSWTPPTLKKLIFKPYGSL